MDLTALWQLIEDPWTPYFASMAPWEILEQLPSILVHVGRTLGADYREVALQVWVHQSATVMTDLPLAAPCIIDEGAVIGPDAYLRGSAYIGRHAVVGHAAEVKNAILMTRAIIAHYNYVGDSILGAYAHLGAGAILSNLRQDNAPVWTEIGGIRYPTKRRKMGALVGDFAEVGCNAVLNPGTVLAAHAVVRPLSSVKGYIPTR